MMGSSRLSFRPSSICPRVMHTIPLVSAAVYSKETLENAKDISFIST